MTDEATQTNSAPETKPAAKPKKKPEAEAKAEAKPKAKKRKKAAKPKAKKRKKAANFTFKGSGGAKERKARGEHLLIVRSKIATVKRIDAKLARLVKRTGKFHSRNNWLAKVIEKASRK